MLGAQASGTQVKVFELTLYHHRGRVYIWYPAAVGPTLRVAHIMAELG